MSNFVGISNFNNKVDTLKSNALRSKLPHAAVLLSNHQVTLQDKKIHGSWSLTFSFGRYIDPKLSKLRQMIQSDIDRAANGRYE